MGRYGALDEPNDSLLCDHGYYVDDDDDDDDIITHITATANRFMPAAC